MSKEFLIFKLKNISRIDTYQPMNDLFRRGGTSLKIFFLILIIPIFFSAMAYGNDSNEIPFYYQPLIERLTRDGFDIEFLSKLLTDCRAEFIPEVMTISISSKEMPEVYIQFLTPESILLAKRFLRQNLKTLKRMERQFHVEKEVVVAILLVESRFGEYTGKYRVIPTLASMALTDSSDNLWSNYSALREIDPEISYDWLESLAKKRADWAYRELKSFLNIIRHEKIDPLEVRSSYAGALGMAQFMPSSFLAYGLSKKGFEKWLLDKEEAIFSIGNYLKCHGWKKNLPIAKKRQILWCYNHSDPYIETIVRVAQKTKD